MESNIPILQEATHTPDPKAAGVWEQKRQRGVYPCLDLWGRHEYFLDIHHPEKQHSTIPRAVQLGHGEMHLDDWFAPEELVGGVIGKEIFEVKLNVRDYKLQELKVELKGRLLTVEGRHHPEHDDGMRNGSLCLHFVRSVTLPKCVSKKGLEGQVSADGHCLTLKAPTRPHTSPGPQPVLARPAEDVRG